MDFVEQIKLAAREGRFSETQHARKRLREREIEAWQVQAGVDDGAILRKRPHDRPHPSIVVEQFLPDGTAIVAVWSWNEDEEKAMLVTVYFPDQGVV